MNLDQDLPSNVEEATRKAEVTAAISNGTGARGKGRIIPTDDSEVWRSPSTLESADLSSKAGCLLFLLEILVTTVTTAWEAITYTLTQRKRPEPPSLDADFAAAIEQRGLRSGKVMDVSGASSRQPLDLAGRGLEVWATDYSDKAVVEGFKLARAAKVRVQYVVDDLCASRLPGEQFDVVLDRGYLPGVLPERRPDYAKSIARLLVPGGLVLFKCYFNGAPPISGPYRLTCEEIAEVFCNDFDVEESRFTEAEQGEYGKRDALFMVLRKR